MISQLKIKVDVKTLKTLDITSDRTAGVLLGLIFDSLKY